MVIKTETCRFSGLRIYPGHGSTLIRTDSQLFKFLSKKCKRLYTQRLKPSKLAWTTLYRKQHKKGQTEEASRKKRRVNRSAVSRSVVGMSLEVIQKKRGEKTEVRQAARDAALREIKERTRKVKDEKKKKADTVKVTAKSAPKPKTAGASKGGKGGKR
mmetsp:Transcript_34870/g.48366  ORF Transcript_34870/g.48366 Transcript_34870/m.48366 type:complete len:158 (+) Transcript_34870:130-603(+)|eukprot:CAMPEP_0196570464 /NCGR_PEP_ID=MMETSP1081-20130531/536_1 /TAXON_ID=36882 /ORGANISM="Pyramimonas amylifera, Strain CCMP720" /LENGTH=157 /DNA_ID=CAMNT_0041886913 /DNA_START=129 /DNA_END=602 /DNA_ORIENTATION=-